LRDNTGRWREDEHGLQSFVLDYFTHLFTSSAFGSEGEIIDAVESRVTPDMNNLLLTDYCDAKIQEAVFQMYPTKAPGPDGMPPIFFQKYWHIVGSDVTRAIKDFLTSGRLFQKINFTNVVPIPKVNHPKDNSQLRPISSCNVLFKIASKVLANRLKLILDKIISPSQSAFISGRLISDNTILAA
ncbi:unnamed protein product, partial [Prunus brigantina]